jgi:hypothetical protein
VARALLPLLAAVAALAAAGCGASPHAPRSAPAHGPPPPPSAAAVSGLRFVGRPRVELAGGRTPYLTTTFRLNRALPQDGSGVRASLAVTGAERNDQRDVPPLQPVAGFRRCYAQQDLPEPSATFAGAVSVTLDVQSRLHEELVARVPVNHTSVRDAPRALGCPRAAPVTRCRGIAPGNGMTIALVSAGGGASCATLRRVMVGVEAWANPGRCFRDLCVARHRRTRGFRCTVAKIGEADWRITCRRGRAVVTGTTAE